MRYSRILIVLLALAFCLQGCANTQTNRETDIQEISDSRPNQALDDLSHLLDDYLKAMENGVPSDMSLTLYNITPHIAYNVPVRKADIMQTSEIVLDSTELSSRIDYLNKIDYSILDEPEITFYEDLRIYYYIETESDGIVLEVGMYGTDGTIFVNGVEVEYDPVFFELVEPYLDAYTMNIVPEPDSWNEEGP